MVKKVFPIIGGIVRGVSLMLQGCVPLVAAGAVAAAGAGAIAYTEGSLDITYAASLNRTWDATIGALRDAQLSITDQQRDVAHATVKGRRGDNTPVAVALDQAGPNTTTVQIRASRLGTAAG
jgi:hypothetical protein